MQRLRRELVPVAEALKRNSPKTYELIAQLVKGEILTRISHRENRKGNFSRFFDAALGQSRS